MSQRKASCPKARAGSWAQEENKWSGLCGKGSRWGPWSTQKEQSSTRTPPAPTNIPHGKSHPRPGPRSHLCRSHAGAHKLYSPCLWGLRGQICRHPRDPHQGLSWNNPRHPLMAQQDCPYWGHQPYISHYISIALTPPTPNKGVVLDT